MGQKVWVVDDQPWNEPPRRSPVEMPAPAKREPASRPLPQAMQKCPAVSFSLSMFVWGGGQMYVGSYRAGSLFMAAMFFFYSMLSTLIFFREPAGRILVGINVPKSILLAAALVFLVAGLLAWAVGAVDAYYRAARLRSDSFNGVGNDLGPFFCSVLFPGWGQFLNGQPRKGAFFLLFGMAGLFSAITAAAILYLWPVLNASPARPLSEGWLVAALLLLPVSLLMWIVAVYDAIRSRREIAEQRMRQMNPGYRMRQQGGVRRLVPRSTAVLCLLLAISVGMQSIPQRYYRHSLEMIQAEAQEAGMEIIPEMIQKLISYFG